MNKVLNKVLDLTIEGSHPRFTTLGATLILLGQALFLIVLSYLFTGVLG